MGGRRRARRAVSVSLLGVRRTRHRSLGLQSPNACRVVAGDRLADVIGDRLRGARPGPEGAQPDDLLGSRDRLERSAAARAQVAGVFRCISVTPDAGAACCALEMRHGISGPWRSEAVRRPRGRCARAHGGGSRWSPSSCRRERDTARDARGGSEPRPRACSRLDHGLAMAGLPRALCGGTRGSPPGDPPCAQRSERGDVRGARALRPGLGLV
jgi:hypothetical protein